MKLRFLYLKTIIKKQKLNKKKRHKNDKKKKIGKLRFCHNISVCFFFYLNEFFFLNGQLKIDKFAMKTRKIAVKTTEEQISYLLQ